MLTASCKWHRQSVVVCWRRLQTKTHWQNISTTKLLEPSHPTHTPSQYYSSPLQQCAVHRTCWNCAQH